MEQSKRAVVVILLYALFAGGVSAHPGSGIVVGRDGQVYFVLYGPNNRIMKTNAQGEVAAFVIDERLHAPHHLVIDQQGNLSTVSDADSIVWKIKPTGRMTKLYSPDKQTRTARVGTGGDPFTIDRAGNIYCINYPGRSQILKITPEGRVTPLAGSDYRGYADGKGREAKFGDLYSASMAWGPGGVLYVTDGRHIRKVAPDGTVSTLGIRPEPGLGLAMGLAVDQRGNVYVADYRSQRILKITPQGKATTLAGSGDFFRPSGVAVGPAGEVYVPDNPPRATRIWKISSDGEITMVASVE